MKNKMYIATVITLIIVIITLIISALYVLKKKYFENEVFAMSQTLGRTHHELR